jgi:UDP-N-acetylmuramate: L-alanyl-gamma-D-glutamyl-meso-diaminopimelate ligase
VWGIFEPRSWTNRRNVHQADLGRALREADAVLLAPVFQVEKVPAELRLDAQKVVEDVAAAGIPAQVLPGAREIAAHVGQQARPGDVVLVMSNGGFDGIHDLLLAELTRAAAGT